MVEPGGGAGGGPGQRLGAGLGLGGVSTLEPGLRPPSQPPGPRVALKVQMLDDSVESFQLAVSQRDHRAPGKVLFDLVCVHLNLTEGDYFGLEYQDHRKMTVWLDLLKPALKQIRRPKNTILRFVVKFFPPDHTQLTEELTRYLFALQVKRDLACGRLICNDSSAALMVSHIIQSETGDLDEAGSFQHLLHHKYHPDQEQLREQIQECQRDRVGQTPAESDYQLLEVARRLDLYGVRLHPATDREGTQLSLAVEHSGVLVLQGSTRINSFNWSKIRKLSFKRKRFLIKLRSDPVQNPHHDTLEFSMATRDSCKNFWKICVEHHAFFRLLEEPKPRPRTILFSRGSSFRFSGRTQKQVIDHVKDSDLKRVPFQRSLVLVPDLVSVELWSGPFSASVSDHLVPVLTGGPLPAVPFSLYTIQEVGHQLTGERFCLKHHIPFGLSPVSMVSGLSKSCPSPIPRQSVLSKTTNVFPQFNEAFSKSCISSHFQVDGVRTCSFVPHDVFVLKSVHLSPPPPLLQSFPVAVATDESFPDSVKTLLSSHYDPVLEFHRGFLREMEQRLALLSPLTDLWVGGASLLSDLSVGGASLLTNLWVVSPPQQQLTVHLQKHPECLVELERCCRSSRRAEALCRELEQQRVCYLNLNTFLLRPLHRLLHYRLLLERLCKHYAPTHQDFRDCRAALADVSELVQQLQGSMVKMENLQKLLELQRELSGADNLVAPGREFIRLGCLSKLSGKGLQQRMFFLFSDVLLYTSRGMTSSNQFKVHGQLPLFGMSVRESEEEWGVPHCFTLIGQKQTVVAAPSEEEPEEELSTSRSGHRSNSSSSTVQVCWHRSTGLSMVDCSLAVENQLSGNLLRKFKNSSGWQKLWVVFTNFSLFFYKTHQDDAPLASLPLLGYSVSIPSEAENINKDYVFKLQFKAHVYYFRSESEYAFLRYLMTLSTDRVPIPGLMCRYWTILGTYTGH
uniref:FERM, ARHGEF and pleckstrin domain-containing protein 1 n=1 Tax=Salarias fasciatus TaxID=181472 RepID=A0A672J7M9_SALFA